jgi:hypothetical protein
MKVTKANCGASVPASGGKKKTKMAMGGMVAPKKQPIYYAEGGMVGTKKKAKMAAGGMAKKDDKMAEMKAGKKGMAKSYKG